MKESTYYKKMDTIKKKAIAKTGVVSTVKNIVTAPVNLFKKQWKKNQDFRNKNSTYEKFKQNSK